MGSAPTGASIFQRGRGGYGDACKASIGWFDSSALVHIVEEHWEMASNLGSVGQKIATAKVTQTRTPRGTAPAAPQPSVQTGRMVGPRTVAPKAPVRGTAVSTAVRSTAPKSRGLVASAMGGRSAAPQATPLQAMRDRLAAAAKPKGRGLVASAVAKAIKR